MLKSNLLYSLCSTLSRPRLPPLRPSGKLLPMEAPEVRYAKSGDINIAYSVVGEGPFDLVFVGGWLISSLEYAWEGPPADFFRRRKSVV